jgi:outer membrane protein assembly factor BamB
MTLRKLGAETLSISIASRNLSMKRHRATGLLFLLTLGGASVAVALAPVPPRSIDPASVVGPFTLVNTVDRNIPATWDTTERLHHNIKWAARLGDFCSSGMLVANGRIFVGTNNTHPRDPRIKDDKAILMCFREEDGEFLWQAVHEPTCEKAAGLWQRKGLRAPPIHEAGRLYYLAPSGEVVCASAEDGTPVWRFNFVKELGVHPRFGDCPGEVGGTTPLIVGDFLYVNTGNGRNDEGKLPAPDAPSFVALNKKTGRVIWQSNAPGADVLQGQWSSPVFAEARGRPQVIFGGGDGWLYAFEPKTGELIWKFDGNPRNTVFKPNGGGTRNHFVASPMISNDRLYAGTGLDPCSGSGVAHLWCLDLRKTGDLSPERLVDGITAPNPNAGVVWSLGGPIAPPAAKGRDIAFGRTISTCIVHEGLVYAAEMDGYLHCLDAANGHRYWTHDLRAQVFASPYWVDGKVYLGTEDGDMYVFAHGKEKRLLGTVEMDNPIRAAPTAANGVLYVLTRTHLYAIAAR